jgi:hypothetical protein
VRIICALALAAAMAGCKEKVSSKGEHSQASWEQRQAQELIAAWEKHDMSGVSVGCIIIDHSEKLDATIVAQLNKICRVDFPLAIIQKAIVGATKTVKGPTESLTGIDQSMRDIECMDIMIEDGINCAAKNHPIDPSVKSAFDVYAKLCPKQAAKISAKIKF